MNLDRRKLLKSTAAGAVLAPFIPVMQRSARAAASPKRLIVLYSSNGTVREKWLPTMNGSTLVLPEILKPLEALKSELLVVDGLDYLGDWNGHELGMILTGSKPKIAEEKNNWATSISLDQAFANVTGADTRIRSIQAGVQVEAYARWVSSISYSAPLQPMTPENSPLKIFDRVFAGVNPGADTAKLEQRLVDQQSIIDFVHSDLMALRPKLGTDEQRKVDAHLQNISDMEKKLRSTATTPICRVPTRPTLDFNANDNIPVVGRVQMDLLVMAMACDLTRVGTVQYGRGGALHRHTWLGSEFSGDPDNGPNDQTSGIHGLAHNEANPSSRAKLARCHGWYAGEVAYLHNKLKSVPDPSGTGTLADNTLIMWVNELSTGNHSFKGIPFVLLGSLGGRLRTGKVASFPGQSHAKLLVNVGQALGMPITTFGDPTFGNAPLPGLLA
jgi:hypothetical protein